MREAIETIEYKGHIISVYHDDLNESPREMFDHMGTMAAFHSRYNLGDQDHELDLESAREMYENEPEDVFLLPLYLFDHSGITMSTRPFTCPWDSGQVGIIFVTKQTIRDEFGVKRISAKLRARVYEILQGEVKEYDQFLTGEVYGYEIEKDDEHVDSCWGYYGDPADYMIPEAKGIVDHATEEQAGLIY